MAVRRAPSGRHGLRRALIAAASFLLVLAACGDGDDLGVGATTVPAATVPPALLDVREARAAADGAVRVSGSLLQVATADGMEMRLCGAVTRSIPPRCVGDYFVVTGVDTAGLEMQVAPDGTLWNVAVMVTGSKSGGVLAGVSVVAGTG